MLRVFLAGATGAIGRPLGILLHRSGWTIVGMTRRAEAAASLRAVGIEPAVVDVFDPAALTAAVVSAKPDVIIHQLTDLPDALDPAQMPAALSRNARIRTEGTANLVHAAQAAGVRRVIAQSVAWAYAPGREPHREDDPLDLEATGTRRVTVDGIATLERQVLQTPGIAGVVLRYGQFYGPGTGFETAQGELPLHVDAAAQAALLAAASSTTGIFNIAEANSPVDISKARTELAWDPSFRLPTGIARGA